MTITEKAAYLKGLAQGLDLDADSKEGKMFAAIMELLDDMALTVSDLEDAMAELSEQVDAVDEDLDALEQDFYDDEDYDDKDDEQFYEVTCPSCGDTVCLDEDMLLEGGVDCPNCGEKLEFDFDCDCDCDCDDEDCDCDCCK